MPYLRFSKRQETVSRPSPPFLSFSLPAGSRDSPHLASEAENPLGIILALRLCLTFLTCEVVEPFTFRSPTVPHWSQCPLLPPRSGFPPERAHLLTTLTPIQDTSLSSTTMAKILVRFFFCILSLLFSHSSLSFSFLCSFSSSVSLLWNTSSASFTKSCKV